MAKTSIKLKFRASTDKSGTKEGSLYFQVIHDSTPRQAHTRQHIFADEWDSTHNAIVCAAAQTDSRKQHLLSVQRIVTSQEALLRAIVSEKADTGKPFSADDIIEEYSKREPGSSSMFTYIEKLIERLVAMKREGTAKTYKSTLNSFRRFRCDIDLSFYDFNAHVVEEYDAWLKHKGLTRNTISFYMRTLRTICNRAIEDGLAEKSAVSPFTGVFTGMDKTAKRALPIGIISRIKHLDLSATPAQDFARNIFLLSFCLRGMSFIDMAFLKKSNLRNGVLTYTRHKTNQQMKIRWESQMQQILERTPQSTNAFLLPIIKKEDGTERIQYTNKLKSVNRALKRIAEQLDLPSISTYSSRHSWASAAQESNVPLAIISSGMGHNSLSTTQIYLSTISCDKVDDANRMIISGI